jgi:predicted dehydrogenase
MVGTGAYVTKDPYGPGVLARSVASWCVREGDPEAWEIIVACRSEEGRARIERTWREMNEEIGSVPRLRVIPCEGEPFESAVDRAHALMICVPDAAHAEYLERGIVAGVPTWIVKPMASSGSASRSIATLADDLGVPVWVDYHKRFDVSNRVLRSKVLSGEHGSPRLYSVRYSQPRDLPLEEFEWSGATDVFSYIGCHYVDQLLFVFPGIEVLGASATGVPGRVHARLGGAAWDIVLARIDARWQGQPLTAQFEVGWSNPLGSPTKSLQVVELAFDRGKCFMDQTHRGVEVWSDAPLSVPNPYFFSRIHDPLTGRDAYQGYGYDSVRHFLDFTLASASDQAAALANESLPWARYAARVDEIVDLVRASLARTAKAKWREKKVKSEAAPSLLDNPPPSS